MALSDFGLNPYVDLRTGTLYNKVGARSAEELKERENTFVNLRIVELKESPVQGKPDFAHLKEIHHRLLQDVYDWAGKARYQFDAAKQNYQGGRSVGRKADLREAGCARSSTGPYTQRVCARAGKAAR